MYDALRTGVELEDGPAKAKDVRLVSGRGRSVILALVMQEGRKREVRRLLKAVGLPVRRLKRIRFGPLELGHMKPGQWRDLDPGEVRRLLGTGRTPGSGKRGSRKRSSQGRRRPRGGNQQR